MGQTLAEAKKTTQTPPPSTQTQGTNRRQGGGGGGGIGGSKATGMNVPPPPPPLPPQETAEDVAGELQVKLQNGRTVPLLIRKSQSPADIVKSFCITHQGMISRAQATQLENKIRSVIEKTR